MVEGTINSGNSIFYHFGKVLDIEHHNIALGTSAAAIIQRVEYLYLVFPGWQRLTGAADLLIYTGNWINETIML